MPLNRCWEKGVFALGCGPLYSMKLERQGGGNLISNQGSWPHAYMIQWSGVQQEG